MTVSIYAPSPGFPFGGDPNRIPFPAPAPGLPPGGIPFEGGGYVPQPPVPIPSVPPPAGQGGNPFQQLLASMFARPEAQQWLQGLFGGQLPSFGSPSQPAAPGIPPAGLPTGAGRFQGGGIADMVRYVMGRQSGAQGTRGPEPSPFAGLGRFSGPFGNGGGAIAPGMGLWQQR